MRNRVATALPRPFGRPGDRNQQRRILLDALWLIETAHPAGRVLVDLPYDWGEEFASIVDV